MTTELEARQRVIDDVLAYWGGGADIGDVQAALDALIAAVRQEERIKRLQRLVELVALTTPSPPTTDALTEPTTEPASAHYITVPASESEANR